MLLSRGMTDIVAKMRKEQVVANPDAYLLALPKELGLDAFSSLIEFEVVFYQGSFMSPPCAFERAYVRLGTGLVLKLEEGIGVVYARFPSYAEALESPLGYDIQERPIQVHQLTVDELTHFRRKP